MSIGDTVISKEIYLPNLNAGLTYDIDTSAAFAYTITNVYQIQTSSGTVTAAIKINGTAVTGLSSISVSSTPQDVAASGANAVSVGDQVQVVFNTIGATNIKFTLAATRNVPCGGFVNKFCNPALNIVQRGSSGSIAAGAPAYTADGWIIGATGANAGWGANQPGPMVASGSNACAASYAYINGNTGMTDTFIKQRIEGSTASCLSSQQVTFQVIVQNATGATITPTLTIKHAGALDNWSSPVTDVNAVSLQSAVNGTATILAYTFTANASSWQGIEATLDFGAALNANTKSVYFSGFDLRVTPGVPTGLNNNPPFLEQRPVAVELALCQRYFASTFGNNVAPAQNAGLSGALQAQPYGTTAGELYTQWNFPVQMRANPTITTYNPSAANANWRDKTGSSDIVVSVDPDSAIGKDGVMIGSQTTALTAGHRCYIHATASAEL